MIRIRSSTSIRVVVLTAAFLIFQLATSPGRPVHADTTTPAPGTGTVYDAFTDFSPVSNPTSDGIWSYGYTWTLGGTFNLYTSKGYVQEQISNWTRPETYLSPNVNKNISGQDIISTFGCIVHPASEFLHMHPGPNNEFSVVRWTAPVSGTYEVDSAFKSLRFCGTVTTTDVHVLHNSTSLSDQNLSAYMDWGELVYSTSLYVNAGDTVDFVVGVGANGNYSADSTGLRATITLVQPTPPPTPTNTPTPTPTATGTPTPHDLTERVSVASDGTQGNDHSYHPSISGDGRYVAFESNASNLVSGDTNNQQDIFVRDRQTGQTTRVSIGTNGSQVGNAPWHPSISDDGRYVAFDSPDVLVISDTNDVSDIYMRDLQAGQTLRVSLASDGSQANGNSFLPALSPDGRFVAFVSNASNLVSGDTNNAGDVFVCDRQTGQTTRVSVASDGSQGNNLDTYTPWDFYAPSISADGRYVAFESTANNLVGGDTNGVFDIFVHDQQTGQTTRVSVGSGGTQANDMSRHPSISADGRYVAFMSFASNLVGGDNTYTWDVFVHDRQTGQTTRVSTAFNGSQASGDSLRPSITGDGRYVAFDSGANNLVSADTNNRYDIFVHDLQAGETTRVSVASDDSQGNEESIQRPSISTDGRFVAYGSYATNLVSDDTNGKSDIFVRDRLGGAVPTPTLTPTSTPLPPPTETPTPTDTPTSTPTPLPTLAPCSFTVQLSTDASGTHHDTIVVSGEKPGSDYIEIYSRYLENDYAFLSAVEQSGLQPAGYNALIGCGITADEPCYATYWGTLWWGAQQYYLNNSYSISYNASTPTATYFVFSGNSQPGSGGGEICTYSGNSTPTPTATLTPTPTSTPVPGPFEVACGDVDGLIAAINAANDEVNHPGLNTINLAPGCTYTLTAVDNVSDAPNGLPLIPSEIIINGNGAAIQRDAAAPFRFFYIAPSGSLTLIDLTLTNGYVDGNGGAIHNFGNLTLVGSILSYNTAMAGGAVYTHGGVLQVESSTFSNNSAAGASPPWSLGGAIAAGGAATIANGTFTGNSAHAGGAVWHGEGTLLTITNTTISNNAATAGHGGGILNWGTARITDSIISNNTATGGGGGISNVSLLHTNSGNLTLINTLMMGNAAAGGGGGVYNGSGSTLTAIDSTISDNGAGAGGGVYSEWGSVFLTRVDLHRNVAQTGSGGGILFYPFYSSGTLSITEGRIADNHAQGSGGAVYLGGGTIDITNTLITGNTATSGTGGAVSIYYCLDCGGTTSIINSCIVSNNDTSVNNGTGDVVDMTSNWWGSTDGPSGVGPGSGDSVSTRVNFTPFLTSAPVGCPSLSRPRPDLTLSSSDITFSLANPAAGETVSIQAVITNVGSADASNIQVDFYDFDTLIGEAAIPTLPAGSTTEISIQATFPEASFRLITVKVDPENAIQELNEDNNEASQVLQIGRPDFSTAEIVVQASEASTCRGGPVAINGQAHYDFAAIPGSQDFPVQGGQVTVQVIDPETGNPISVFTGSHTDVGGNFSQAILAPGMDGNYTVVLEVTDSTLSRETQTTLQVSGACPTPPPPPIPSPGPAPDTPPLASQDAYMLSEDISFSSSNPDLGEPITIYAYIHYYGLEPVFNIPVTINDIYPVGGSLRTFRVGSALVSFPNGGGTGTVVVSLPWTNSAEGAHTIQVVIEPAFEQYTGNDEATRSIFVGQMPTVEVDKSVTLLVDADEDGVPSPGDTLAYTITFANMGETNLTGATVIDDFDEGLLGLPFDISEGGGVSDGTIVWDIGAVAAGGHGEVTYRTTIIPPSAFPVGTSTIVNTALFTTDQTAPVADRVELAVTRVNHPPVANAGPDQTVNEGNTVSFAGSFTDLDSADTHTIQWDFGDGASVSGTLTPTHIYADNGVYTVTLTVADNNGGVGSDTLIVIVNNVVPTVDAGPDQTVNEDDAVNFAGSFSDPGSVDTHIIQWDFDDGTTTSDTLTPTHIYPDNGVYTVTLTVTDKDGGVGTNTLTVTVNNVVPTVDAGPDHTVNEGDMVSFAGSFSDPGSADTHTIVWDFGDGTTASDTLTPTHTYPDNGVYTVVLTVTDDDGGVGSDILIVTVNNVVPTVDAGPDHTVNEGDTVNFVGGFSDPGALDTHTIVWDFGDGWTVADTLTPTHVYPDNGVYTVTLTVTDKDGGVGTDTLKVTVNNVAPMVSASSGDTTIIQGQTFSGSGSFSDPGADTWAATVNYGDGTGAQPLLLVGNAFNLSHTYTVAGTYSVTITVTDDDGGAGDAHLTVSVQTPQQATQDIIAEVQSLTSDGVLNQGQGNALVAKLEAAIRKIEQSNPNAARNQLQAFINQVNDFINAGLLAPGVGQPLIDAANEIISQLGG